MKWKVIGEWGVGWGVRVPCSAFEDLGLLRCREAGEWGGWGWGGVVGGGGWGGVGCGGSVWAEAKDGQLGNNFKGFSVGDFCCQSFGQFRPPYRISHCLSSHRTFPFSTGSLPHQPGPGLMVTCSFKNSSREENDCQLPLRCRTFSRSSRGLHSATGPRTALPRRRRRGPGPLTGVQSRAGEADRRARAAVAPLPALAAPAPLHWRKLGESGRLALGFAFPADSAPSFGRAGPSLHRSPQVRTGPAIA